MDSILTLVGTAVLGILCLLLIGFYSRAGARSVETSLRQTHERWGFSADQSNLQTQYANTHGVKKGKSAKIQSLHVYPIKSCRGVELKSSRVLPSGLEFDRLYMFAHLKKKDEAPGTSSDEEEVWQFLTLRQIPLLANITVDLWLPKEAPRTVDDSRGYIVAKFPCPTIGLQNFLSRGLPSFSRWASLSNGREICVPLDFPSPQEILDRGWRTSKVQVFRKQTTALNMENTVPHALAQYLGLDASRLSLFRIDPAKYRIPPPSGPSKEALGFDPVIGFQDEFPVNLLGISSVQDLDGKIQKDDNLRILDARRFRANIYVSGTSPYGEDDWKSIRCHSPQYNTLFDIAGRTTRCKLPNVDPANGVRHNVEPDRTLRKHRAVQADTPGTGCLGMQMCPLFPDADDVRNKTGSSLVSYLEVGMEIDVLQ